MVDFASQGNCLDAPHYHGCVQNDYKKAWQHLDAANKLQHEGDGHHSSQDATLLQALKHAFPVIPKGKNPPTLSRDPYQLLMSGQAGHDSQVPVFVVGMPRSGSTLVEQILASHSQVFGAGAYACCSTTIASILLNWRNIFVAWSSHLHCCSQRRLSLC